MRLGVVEDDGAGVGPDTVLVTDQGVDSAVHCSEGDLTSYQCARLAELWQEVHARRTPGSKKVNDDWLTRVDDIGKVGCDESLHSSGL